MGTRPACDRNRTPVGVAGETAVMRPRSEPEPPGVIVGSLPRDPETDDWQRWERTRADPPGGLVGSKPMARLHRELRRDAATVRDQGLPAVLIPTRTAETSWGVVTARLAGGSQRLDWHLVVPRAGHSPAEARKADRLRRSGSLGVCMTALAGCVAIIVMVIVGAPDGVLAAALAVFLVVLAPLIVLDRRRMARRADGVSQDVCVDELSVKRQEAITALLRIADGPTGRAALDNVAGLADRREDQVEAITRLVEVIAEVQAAAEGTPAQDEATVACRHILQDAPRHGIDYLAGATQQLEYVLPALAAYRHDPRAGAKASQEPTFLTQARQQALADQTYLDAVVTPAITDIHRSLGKTPSKSL